MIPRLVAKRRIHYRVTRQVGGCTVWDLQGGPEDLGSAAAAASSPGSRFFSRRYPAAGGREMGARCIGFVSESSCRACFRTLNCRSWTRRISTRSTTNRGPSWLEADLIAHKLGDPAASGRPRGFRSTGRATIGEAGRAGALAQSAFGQVVSPQLGRIPGHRAGQGGGTSRPLWAVIRPGDVVVLWLRPEGPARAALKPRPPASRRSWVSGLMGGAGAWRRLPSAWRKRSRLMAYPFEFAGKARGAAELPARGGFRIQKNCGGR